MRSGYREFSENDGWHSWHMDTIVLFWFIIMLASRPPIVVLCSSQAITLHMPHRPDLHPFQRIYNNTRKALLSCIASVLLFTVFKDSNHINRISMRKDLEQSPQHQCNACKSFDETNWILQAFISSVLWWLQACTRTQRWLMGLIYCNQIILPH